MLHSLKLPSTTTSLSKTMSKSESVPGVLDSFTETWSPHLVAANNDHHVKVAKLDGEFIWHAHPNSDELFYLLSGKLIIELEGQDDIVMQVGDMYVIPRGIRHRPVAENASVMLMEHESTVNTGDETSSERTKQVKDIRG
ncbi:RmlC-like cupin [Trichoderma ceciliae]